MQLKIYPKTPFTNYLDPYRNHAPLSGFPCPYVISNNGGKVKGAGIGVWA